MSTISTTIVGGVTLSASGAYTSPLTVISTGAIEAGVGDAIYGPGTQAWIVSNYNTIAATGAGSAGVDLRAGGDVSNLGTIDGRGTGVHPSRRDSEHGSLV